MIAHYDAAVSAEIEEILAGLNLPQKKLSPKYFYDERGSQLFDQITELEEYYPFRTEASILKRTVPEIFAGLGEDLTIVEYGSGSSVKTEILLDHLADLAAYIPLDISGEHLLKSAKRLASRYPHLKIDPIVADYTQPFKLPDTIGRRIVFFPGSTIGNFERELAIQFLSSISEIIGPDGGLLLGVDLKKDPARLHAAYNDSKGVTAAFNLNLLEHLNREYGANFNLAAFRHYAFYNPYAGRIEMHLVSEQDQAVCVAGELVAFREGETLWTESSCKYTVEEFAQLAQEAGLRVKQVWTDEEELFSVQYLIRA
ncbi:MAG: L-histidine N(alpha)-methyltransferase [Chloroflexota bacterium]